MGLKDALVNPDLPSGSTNPLKARFKDSAVKDPRGGDNADRVS